MIVADASWVIALHYELDELHDRAKAALPETSLKRVLLHPLTLAECLVVAARAADADRSADELRRAYTVPDVRADFEVAVRWAKLRARTNLKLPDAVVLDTALQHGADTIATFDAKLAEVTRSHGLAVLGG